MATTYHDVARDALLLAFRGANVATAAGVDPVVWASTTSPRVYPGDRGWIGGRHRGRLPLIEIFQVSDLHSELTIIGGILLHRWRIRTYCGKVDVAEAESQLRAIMLTGLASLRQGPYWYVAGQDAEESAQMVAHPLGHVLEYTITTQNTECRQTFGVDLTPTPPPDECAMGMYRAFDSTSENPLAILLITADQALDNVELAINAAFNSGTTISVGDETDHDRFIAAGVIDPTIADTTYELDFQLRGSFTVTVYIVGATQGDGSIQVLNTVAID